MSYFSLFFNAHLEGAEEVIEALGKEALPSLVGFAPTGSEQRLRDMMASGAIQSSGTQTHRWITKSIDPLCRVGGILNAVWFAREREHLAALAGEGNAPNRSDSMEDCTLAVEECITRPSRLILVGPKELLDATSHLAPRVPFSVGTEGLHALTIPLTKKETLLLFLGS